MNKKLLLLLLLSVNGLTRLTAQNLALYDLELCENNNDTVAFTSLSDNYILSEHPDSLAIPNYRKERRC
jgi:hypothetical protein